MCHRLFLEFKWRYRLKVPLGEFTSPTPWTDSHHIRQRPRIHRVKLSHVQGHIQGVSGTWQIFWSLGGCEGSLVGKGRDLSLLILCTSQHGQYEQVTKPAQSWLSPHVPMGHRTQLLGPHGFREEDVPNALSFSQSMARGHGESGSRQGMGTHLLPGLGYHWTQGRLGCTLLMCPLTMGRAVCGIHS